MVKMSWIAIGLAFMIGLVGCSSSTPDSLMKQNISAMNEMAEALENDKPEEAIEKIKTRIESLNKKFEGLSLSLDEKKKLFEKHEKEIMKAAGRLQKAMMEKLTSEMGKQFGGEMPSMPKFDFSK